MKKLIKIATALLMVSSLSGCADWLGMGDNKTSTTTTKSTTATTAQTTTSITANTTTDITTTGTSQ